MAAICSGVIMPIISGGIPGEPAGGVASAGTLACLGVAFSGTFAVRTLDASFFRNTSAYSPRFSSSLVVILTTPLGIRSTVIGTRACSTLLSTRSVVGFISNRPFFAVSYTHLRAHETRHDLVCRLLLEKK